MLDALTTHSFNTNAFIHSTPAVLHESRNTAFFIRLHTEATPRAGERPDTFGKHKEINT